MNNLESYNPCGNSLWCKLFHEPYLEMRNPYTGETSEGRNVYEFILEQSMVVEDNPT